MSDFMTDLNTYLTIQKAETKTASHSTNAKAGSDLEMTDFLKLMVAQFQNQSMDDTASTSEMMAQMVQMSVIQAVSNLSDQLTASSNMSYAASLVGKDVTIANNVGKKVTELHGTVTGTGMLNGEQILFVNGEQYKLSDVMAVGTIPSSVSGTKSAAQTESNTVKRLANEYGITETEAQMLQRVWNRYWDREDVSADEMSLLNRYGLTEIGELHDRAVAGEQLTETEMETYQRAADLGLIGYGRVAAE